MISSPTPVSNTAIGSAASFPFAPGGVGGPLQAFSNWAQYTAVANSTSAVTVVDANVTANSIILFTLGTVGGTVGAGPIIKTITPGTGFTFTAAASDTSTYNILRIG